MALPQPTALTNKPKAGNAARLYMCPEGQATISETDEVPLTSEDIGLKGSGDVASVRTHASGMMYSKAGVTKSFSFTMHAASNNTIVGNILAAADGKGDAAIMKFVIANADGSEDYGFCIVNDKSAVQAPDGIFGWLINCSVLNEGEFDAAV